MGSGFASAEIVKNSCERGEERSEARARGGGARKRVYFASLHTAGPPCCAFSGLGSYLVELLLSALGDEGLVDVWNDTTSSDGGLDEGVKLFVTTDSELQVARSDALDLEVLGSVA